MIGHLKGEREEEGGMGEGRGGEMTWCARREKGREREKESAHGKRARASERAARERTDLL